MGKQNNTVKFAVPGFFGCSGIPACSGVLVFRGVPVFLVLVHAKYARGVREELALRIIYRFSQA